MQQDFNTASDNQPSHPSIGLDLDGCCDEHNPFFKTLSGSWPGKVYVISYRSDRAKAIADLARLQIRYDELILVNSFGAKAEMLAGEGITIFSDDQPEMLKNVSPERTVMLVRNEGNFDFDDRRWILSNETGKLI